MQMKSLLSTLPIIHFSMVIGLVIFTGFVYWNNPDFNAAMNSSDIFTYLVPVVAASGYFASKAIFQNLTANIARTDGLQNKLSRYQVATIIKYALLEGPAILALIAYYFSGNALHLVIALSLIAYFFSQRPTRKKVLDDLKLSLEEQKEIDSSR